MTTEEKQLKRALVSSIVDIACEKECSRWVNSSGESQPSEGPRLQERAHAGRTRN